LNSREQETDEECYECYDNKQFDEREGSWSPWAEREL
jgi:hypothetical protein